MNAFVSGQSRLALIVDGNSQYFVRHGGGGVHTPMNPLMMGSFVDSPDVRQFESVTIDQVVDELSLAVEQDTALQFLLALMDHVEESDLRLKLVDRLDELSRRPAVGRYLSNRLYAFPLPESAIPEMKTLVAELGLAHPLGSEILSVLLRQSQVAVVHGAWEELAATRFQNDADRYRFFSAAVLAGLTRAIVTGEGQPIAADCIPARCSGELVDAWIQTAFGAQLAANSGGRVAPRASAPKKAKIPAWLKVAKARGPIRAETVKATIAVKSSAAERKQLRGGL